MDEHVARHDPRHGRPFAHHLHARDIAEQRAPGLRALDRMRTHDNAMIGKARRQRAHQFMHGRGVGALHGVDLVENDDVFRFAQIDPAGADEPLAIFLGRPPRRVEQGEIGIDQSERRVLPADGRDFLGMGAAQFRPQEVPARVADNSIAVGMGGMELPHRLVVLGAGREDEIAGVDGVSRDPAQFLRRGDETGNLLVDYCDSVSDGPRRSHGSGIVDRECLEHDDARRHVAEILVHHPLPADDDFEAHVDGEMGQP
jgi:hypothetical protein